MRKAIVENLGRLGRGIQEMDKAYSQRIGDMYAKSSGPVKAFAYTLGGASPSFIREKYDPSYTRTENMITQYVLPVTNAVPKYVLPTVGVTLAGKALMDLTSAFSEADAVQPTQIQM